jgi:hypothetical protein
LDPDAFTILENVWTGISIITPAYVLYSLVSIYKCPVYETAGHGSFIM